MPADVAGGGGSGGGSGGGQPQAARRVKLRYSSAQLAVSAACERSLLRLLTRGVYSTRSCWLPAALYCVFWTAVGN